MAAFDDEKSFTSTNNTSVMDTNTAWIAVGSSGVGKSSLINLFCNANVVTSSSSASCSKAIAKYQSKSKYGNFPLIDTIGFEDSDGINNEEIISQLLQFINKNKCTNVKILWMINGNIREAPEYQKQALFINSLKKNNIWQSVIIIVKSVSPKLASKKAQGAISSIKKLNIDNELINNINIISYTCYNWLSNVEKLETDEMQYTNKQKEKLGIMNENDIILLIINEMNKIQSTQIIFNNQKCIKCGQIGDARLLSPKCHFGKKYEEYHSGTQQIIRVHDENATVEPVYDEKRRYYHPKGTEWYHNGRWENQKGGRVLAGIFSLGISETANWGYYTCCKAHDSSDGCRERWICCEHSPASAGCTCEIIKTYAYSKWTCCGRKEELDGCKEKVIYDCCNEPYNSCAKRCLKCKQSWNDSTVQGCGIGNDYRHEIVTIAS